MTAGDIQRALIHTRYRRSFVLPNYTPKTWWECDVFELTASGYFYEYEIKLTLSDFRADATKSRKIHTGYDQQAKKLTYDTKVKHQQLGQPCGPVCFYFVAPVDLIPLELLPSWAGLIAVAPRQYGRFCHALTVRSAPRLHTQKCDSKVVSHAQTIPYWRFHNLLLFNRASAPAHD